MKYFITIILLITILIYGQLLENGFPIFLNISLIVLILTVFLLSEFSVLNRKFKSDFKIRTYKKNTGSFWLSLAIYWTILLILEENYKNIIFTVLLLWVYPIVDLIMYFIYKNKKPFTIFIKENQLVLNKIKVQKRDITELNQIRFDRFNKKLILDFQSKNKITIRTMEYESEDIQRLLEIMIDKSEHNVFMPQNYKPN